MHAAVFHDRSGDGVWGADDEAAPNATVRLETARGDVVSERATDASGACAFAQLEPARYALHAELPLPDARWSARSAALTASLDRAVDGDAVEPQLERNRSSVDALGRSPRVRLAANYALPTLYAGYFVPIRVRACLFDDRAGDARRDEHDEPVPRVVAVLERAAIGSKGDKVRLGAPISRLRLTRGCRR